MSGSLTEIKTPALIPEKESNQLDAELIKAIAFDIGKEVVSHVRIMYPAAFDALGKSGQLSLRNCVHNEIMAALKTTDEQEILQRLERRRKQRRDQHAAYDRIRKQKD